MLVRDELASRLQEAVGLPDRGRALKAISVLTRELWLQPGIEHDDLVEEVARDAEISVDQAEGAIRFVFRSIRELLPRWESDRMGERMSPSLRSVWFEGRP